MNGFSTSHIFTTSMNPCPTTTKEMNKTSGPNPQRQISLKHHRYSQPSQPKISLRIFSFLKFITFVSAFVQIGRIALSSIDRFAMDYGLLVQFAVALVGLLGAFVFQCGSKNRSAPVKKKKPAATLSTSKRAGSKSTSKRPGGKSSRSRSSKRRRSSKRSVSKSASRSANAKVSFLRGLFIFD
jgi:hypothetical protein